MAGALARLILLVLAVASAPACSACPAEARERAAHPDYATPEAAGASFFAALGCDDAAGEYRAFGEPLKARYGATMDLWLLARAEVREDLGLAVRFAHRLQPARTEVRVGLLMQAQHFLEFEERDGRRVGLMLQRPPGAWLTLEGKRAQLSLAAEDPVLRGLDAASVTRVTLATEWKIADWVLPTAP